MLYKTSGDALCHNVETNYTEAVKWYRRAANQGLQLAQFALGGCYEFGYGVPIDNVEAYKWFYIAFSGDDTATASHAKENIDFLQRLMTPEQIAEAQHLSREFVPEKEMPDLSSGNPASTNNPTASGTGFFITDDGYLISNYHVVKDAAQVRLVTSAGIDSRQGGAGGCGQ